MSRPRKWKLYCDPNDLHTELMKMKMTGITSNQLGKMYQDIIKGIKSRPNFCGYFGEMLDEMEFLAIHNLVKYTHNYNPLYYSTNTNAAFTYCSRIVFQCFTMTITAYKKKEAKESKMMEYLIAEAYNRFDFDNDNLYNCGVETE